MSGHLQKGKMGYRFSSPYRSPGVDGLIQDLLQERREGVIPYLVKIFRACMSIVYVSDIWR
jgi:hypothetical protein